jgi:molybdopterin molybdotransferase
MISVSEAKTILQNQQFRGKTIHTSLSDSLHKIVSEDIFSPMDVPSFDNSAMDGYAMQFDGSRDTWNVKAVVQAGDTKEYSTLLDEAVRIFTGSKMPNNADTVIPQELITLGSNAHTIHYLQSGIIKGNNVRHKGEQCKKGDLILPKDTIINSGIIGFLATLGISKVPVYQSPSVACIITGNELKELGEALKEGEIYNSNGPLLRACLQSIHIDSINFYRVKDEEKTVIATIQEALQKHDCIILSGGISVGDYDFVKSALQQLGVEEFIYKIKQRPGKPLFVGKWKGKWVFALPGNPASVASCFNHYVKPCLKFYMGYNAVWEADRVLPLSSEVKKKVGFTFFMKALHTTKNVQLLTGQQSFNMLPFAIANCFVELPEEVEYLPEGTMVNVFDWM